MIEEIEKALREANTLLQDASESQWYPPPVPSVNVNVSKSSISDPTSNITLDTKRLRLRAAVVKSERQIRETVEAMKNVNRELQKALEEWHGA